MKQCDIIIIGAGIYGLYLANLEELKDKRIIVLEIEKSAFKRASLINQARLHNGYHYPRSYQTASDSHKYFERFKDEFAYAINDSFTNIYAIAKNNSLSSATDFESFCKQVDIPLKKVDASKFFKDDVVISAYKTKEYTFDANIIKNQLIQQLNDKNVEIMYSTYIKKVSKNNEKYVLTLNNNEIIETPVVINTTYSSINCINELFGFPLYDIKYELCEICLGKVDNEFKKYSFTIMDGDYFSIMPFSRDNNVYSLTSVHFTPHETCFDKLPNFSCQNKDNGCSRYLLKNCNSCKNKPQSQHKQMEVLLNEFLLDEFKYEYENSIYAIKPIMKNCEDDDARPTIIKTLSTKPTFISCLSGKISTIYIMKDYIANIARRWN